MAVAMLGAVALAFAFPKAQVTWLAPLGAAALFWAWERLSWKRAFFTGWLAGTIFFAISFSWFTYTVGSYVGSFAFAVVLIPALVEGLAFALTGAAFSALARSVPAWLAPVGGAAAFTFFEWLRSVGYIGVPFAQIGYSQVGTPLAVFAAYVGSYGVTFVTVLLGAYLADAVARRRTAPLAVVILVVAGAWGGAYWGWPARYIAPPSIPVAAVQGNIAQSIKWDPNTLPRSISRYSSLTNTLELTHPQLVVWPETVITTDLNDNARNWDLAATTPAERKRILAYLWMNKSLSAQFGEMAKRLHTTLVVGSVDRHFDGIWLKEFNALFTYAPTAKLIDVYDKRQLVPFVEDFPAREYFQWLPSIDLIGRFGSGHDDAVIPFDGLKFAPLICWESAFPDLIHAQIQKGAQLLVIATDDAWFGKSSGTYQHAQIAQMRAIESGMWVMQAASTGISGIIAPDGQWKESTPLDKEALAIGNVGPPAGSFFAHLGPGPVAFCAALLYLLVLNAGRAIQRALEDAA
jgi:apolipoprotein N-acyltransferase